MRKLFFILTSTLLSFTANAQSCPDSNHPHAIDLGLPSGTKWACCNVGATKPEGYGGYYAWAETKEKEKYDHFTYKYLEGEDTDGDGWYDKNVKWEEFSTDIAGTDYDVAHVKWGGNWQMPSWNQIKELAEYCNNEWTTVNSKDGSKFTSKENGKSIFLPAAGLRQLDRLDGTNINCSYWSSTQGTLPPIINHGNSHCIGIGPGHFNIIGISPHFIGYSVRPVWVE